MPGNPDINQLAKRLVDQATGEAPKVDAQKKLAGRRGGLKGGKTRMQSMTDDEKARLSALGVDARKPPAPSDAGGVKVTKSGR